MQQQEQTRGQHSRNGGGWYGDGRRNVRQSPCPGISGMDTAQFGDGAGRGGKQPPRRRSMDCAAPCRNGRRTVPVPYSDYRKCGNRNTVHIPITANAVIGIQSTFRLPQMRRSEYSPHSDYRKCGNRNTIHIPIPANAVIAIQSAFRLPQMRRSQYSPYSDYRKCGDRNAVGIRTVNMEICNSLYCARPGFVHYTPCPLLSAVSSRRSIPPGLKDLKTSGLKDFQSPEGNAQNHTVQRINIK
jgi:hypothetical protein